MKFAVLYDFRRPAVRCLRTKAWRGSAALQQGASSPLKIPTNPFGTSYRQGGIRRRRRRPTASRRLGCGAGFCENGRSITDTSPELRGERHSASRTRRKVTSPTGLALDYRLKIPVELRDFA